MIQDGSPQPCSDEPYCVYKPDRRTTQVFIVNTGKAEARLGSYKVGIDSGVPLGPGLAFVLESEAELKQEWYAVSANGTEITVTTVA